jgi:ribosomal protein S18 acetylase RimI-like enzyme
VADEYKLVAGAPDLVSYLRLRQVAGLTPKSPEQGIGALENSWSFRHVQSVDGEVVAMGRVIGDGGWYFVIADIATLPSHQRRGLGRRVLDSLLEDIAVRAPAGAYVSLLADEAGIPLYRAAGFSPSRSSTAMWRSI